MKSAGFILSILLVFVLPLSALGDDKPNYVAAGVGLYFYTENLIDKTELDNGFNGEMTYGRSIHPNFALEGGIGYFHDGHRDDELRGVPLTLTAIGIYPVEKIRLFAGGGLGLYFMKFHGEIDNVPVKDTDTVFGGHLLLGVNLEVWSSVFIRIENKYTFLEDAEFDGEKANLNGFTALAKFGFSF